MGKKCRFIIVIGFLCLMLSGCQNNSVGSFADNEIYAWDEVKTIIVGLYPPNETIELTENQRAEAVEWIKAIQLGKEDDSYQEISGQSVQIDVSFDDGTTHTFTILCPYVIVDGTGYKAVNKKTCERIDDWANSLTNSN